MRHGYGYFQSLITDEHGEADIGRLALFVLISIVLGAIPTLIVAGIAAAYYGKPFDPQPYGVAIGAICGGFGAALGALGIYLLGDKKPTPPAPPAA